MKNLKIWIVLLGLVMLLTACTGSKPVPVSDLQRFWGPPIRVEDMPDGSQKWHYRYRAEGQGVPVYFVVKDGIVVDQGNE